MAWSGSMRKGRSFWSLRVFFAFLFLLWFFFRVGVGWGRHGGCDSVGAVTFVFCGRSCCCCFLTIDVVILPVRFFFSGQAHGRLSGTSMRREATSVMG